MPMPSNKDLEDKLDKINIMVVEKFAIVNTNVEGVHRRLDTLNGKVADHEKRIQKSEIYEARNDGEVDNLKKARVVPGWVAVVLPIFTALVVWFLTK